MKSKKKNKLNIFLYSIFFIVLIPTIYVYIEHAIVEFNAHDKAVTEGKKIKTLGEGILFISIGIGYIILAILIVIIPNNKIPYIVLLVGTVAVIILYYFRIYGIPILFTDIILIDVSTDWRDVVTKICQQILVIPIGILLGMRINRNQSSVQSS